MEALYKNTLYMDGERQSSRTSTGSPLVSLSSKVTASAARDMGLFAHSNAHNAGTTMLYRLHLRRGPQKFLQLKMRQQQVVTTRSRGGEDQRSGGAYPVGKPCAPLTAQQSIRTGVSFTSGQTDYTTDHHSSESESCTQEEADSPSGITQT